MTRTNGELKDALWPRRSHGEEDHAGYQGEEVPSPGGSAARRDRKSTAVSPVGSPGGPGPGHPSCVSDGDCRSDLRGAASLPLNGKVKAESWLAPTGGGGSPMPTVHWHRSPGTASPAPARPCQGQPFPRGAFTGGRELPRSVRDVTKTERREEADPKRRLSSPSEDSLVFVFCFGFPS